MANSKPKRTLQEPVENASLEMRIPARAEWVRVVRLATAGVAGRAGFAYDDVEDIKLAVAEACNNAILHSTGPDADKTENVSVVTIRWQLLDDGVRISVSDTGRLDVPLLPPRRSIPPVSTILDQLPESGLGLLLIESLMDEVEHESGPHANTTIHMTKRLILPGEGALEARQASARPDPDEPVAKRTSASSSPSQRAQAPASTR